MNIEILRNPNFVGKIFKVVYNINGVKTSYLVKYIESGNLMIQCEVVETGRIMYIDSKNFCRDYIIEKYPEYLI